MPATTTRANSSSTEQHRHQHVRLRPSTATPHQSKVKAWLQSLGIDAPDIKRMVVPVSQSFVTMNGLVQEVEYALLTNPAWMQMSANPAWPWMFQNVNWR